MVPQSCIACFRVADADMWESNDSWNACTRAGVAINPRQTLAPSIVHIYSLAHLVQRNECKAKSLDKVEG